MQINVGLNARANVRVGVFSPDLIENFLRGEGNALRMILVQDRKSTRLNSSHSQISYAVFCLKKKKRSTNRIIRVLRSGCVHLQSLRSAHDSHGQRTESLLFLSASRPDHLRRHEVCTTVILYT